MLGTAVVHNLTEENGAGIRASLERARNGWVEEWVVNSDSSSTGAIVGTGLFAKFDHLQAWPLFMADEFARAGVPIGGTGMVRSLDNTLVDGRWTLPGFGWWKQHKTFVYTQRNGAAPQFKSNRAGDRVTFSYYDGGTADPCSFTVSINGATPALFTSGTTPGWKTVTLHGAVPVGGTVTFVKKSGVNFAYSEVCVWSSAGGLLIHNVGQGGSSAFGAGELNDRWNDASTRESLGQVFAPNVVRVGDDPPGCLIISVGGNDKRIQNSSPTGVPSDALILDAIRHRREQYPDTPALLVAEGQINDTLVPRASWETFVAGMYDLADELDVPLVDQYAQLGPYKQVVADKLNADSSGHLKPVALEALGRSLATVLLN